MAYRATAKTEAHRLNTRQRILDAAKQRVLSGGFATVSMSAVAADACVATGSLYRHFHNKTALCTELFRTASQREVDEVRRTAQGPGNATGRLASTIRNFASRAIHGRHLAYALIAEPLDPALEQERLNFRRAYAELFQALLEEGESSGEFVAMDTAIAAAAIVGMLAESLVSPLAPTTQSLNPVQQKHLTEEICQLCLRAAGARRNLS
ncbi:MAG: TetR/AcrR family transcriptional regulator [Gammaproteobacteria bacterium]|nr:TetR/AcrR family transcriptional regulator [Gammaproteobacteria bacterium]